MWRREERQNSHPSKRTNNGFWNTKKPVLWTLYQDDIIYPRHLFIALMLVVPRKYLNQNLNQT